MNSICYMLQILNIIFITHLMKKVNYPIITPSARKKQKRVSYVERYKQKQDLGRKLENTVPSTARSGWNEQELQERRDKIIEKMHQQNEISRIRIEEQSVQNSFFKDDYLDLELMWYKKIGQIEQQTQKMKINDNREARAIKQLEQDRQNKIIKVQELKAKIDETQRKSAISTVTLGSQQEEQNQIIYRELLKTVEESQKELVALKVDRASLELQNVKLKTSVQKLQNEISQFQNIQYLKISEEKVTQINELIQQEQEELKTLQMENMRIQKILASKKAQNEMSEQDLSIDINVKQQLFILDELQSLDKLMEAKENQLKRAEQFEQNKQFYHEKTRQVETLEKENRKKKKKIQELTQKIKLKSMEMLNMYQ